MQIPDNIVHITSLYASLLALIYLFLSVRVVLSRTTHNVSLGTPEEVTELTKKIRVHGNFSEYIPFWLILMALLEISNWKPLFLHSMWIAFILGRILHIIAIDRKNPILLLRIFWMLLTLVPIFLLSVTLLSYTFEKNI